MNPPDPYPEEDPVYKLYAELPPLAEINPLPDKFSLSMRIPPPEPPPPKKL